MDSNIHQDLYQQLRSNRTKTHWIMVLFFLIIGFFSCVIGWIYTYNVDDYVTTSNIIHNDFLILIYTIIILVIYMVVMIHCSASVIMSMNKGVQIKSRNQCPMLYDATYNMSLASGLPMPHLYIVNDPSPNAFSAGNLYKSGTQWKGVSAIGATKGILKILNEKELEGVIGHEMSHIKDGDTRVESIGLALTSIFAFIGNICMELAWFSALTGDSDDMDYYSNSDSDNNSSTGLGIAVVLFFIGIVGKICAGLSYLTQLMLSRNREYLADAGSVDLTRNPQYLISAFQKLVGRDNMKSANPNSNSLYIVNPDPEVSRSRWSMANILDTHPSIQDRIKRLREM